MHTYVCIYEYIYTFMCVYIHGCVYIYREVIALAFKPSKQVNLNEI